MKTSWNGWAVVLGEDRLRCVFGEDEKAVANNEANRYEDAEVVSVVVRRKSMKRSPANKRAGSRRS